MNKFQEIVQAWGKAIKATPTEEAHATERYNVCVSCPERGQRFGIEKCGACGCPLKAKIYTSRTKNACPLNKWDEIDSKFSRK